MKKKFYSFWGVSQLLVGAMTIGLVSCEKSSELLYDFSETSESSIQSRAISVADSVSLFSNIDEFKKKPETKSYSYYPETDEFYSSNMYAVRESSFCVESQRRWSGWTALSFYSRNEKRIVYFLAYSFFKNSI